MNAKLLIVGMILFGLALANMSCSKNEGPGGNSTIVGKIWVKNYNAELTNLLGEFWAEEEDVYIMYGNDTIPSDDVKTGYNGAYWFKYLQEGEYTIYAMSKDTTLMSPSGKFPVKTKVSISDNGETVEVPTITIVR
ncbi:MAG: hypothetical protein JEZ09_07405 [Salinivirgaceae bacterium]|nr:hypothetical protein [Salinivirgaceae bacterium]